MGIKRSFSNNTTSCRRKNSNRAKTWSVGEWITYWYATYKEQKHAITTKNVQEVYIRCHIIPHIGHYKMHLIQSYQIQEMLTFLLKQGNKSKLKHTDFQGSPLSHWTVKKIRAMLMAAFETAVKEGIITKNPVQNTEPIAIIKKHVEYFTHDQQKSFLEHTKKFRFYAAYRLLFYTGCRRSEILGLSWDCIDFDNCQIHIRQVLVNINGIPILKNYPKTKSSIRTIPVHPDLIRTLKEHKRKQDIEAKNPDWNNEHNLVFTNKDGSPHSPNYFLHNFKKVIKKLGLPKKLRVHSTRHTFATNLLHQGIALSDVQHLGGWADTRVILDIYSHIVQDSHRNAMNQLYEGTQKKEKKSRKKKI